jgi:hypothetical protein
MYYSAVGGEENLRAGLAITSQIQQMVADNLVSRQYHMAVACEMSMLHLKLADALADRDADNQERQDHLAQALEASRSALAIYQQFGFVQVVECVSEEILYRHSLALAANGRQSEATEFLERAYEEMMRKHDMIPLDSPFRKTYLENIELHRDIQIAYAAQNTRAVPPLATLRSSEEPTN